MSKKIFHSILLVAVAVLLADMVIVMGCLYDYFQSAQEQQLKDELRLAAYGVEERGESYLEKLTARDYRYTWRPDYRLTWIASDAIDKLKVLRAGLHLGTLKKNRFEPSHALALALKKEEIKHSLELGTEENARAYLGGMTLQHEGEKGWYLMTYNGYSIGWGKLAGQVVKNHYPKGLRKV